MTTTLLQHSVFVVDQRQRLLETDTDLDILDQTGTTIGTVRQVGQSAARKVFRLVAKVDEYLGHRFEVTDSQGGVLLGLQRPAALRRSRLVVSDAQGVEVGEIAQLNHIGNVRFGLTSGGAPIGELRGRSIRDRSFDILDREEKRVGDVSERTDGPRGRPKGAGRYAVTVEPDLQGPLRLLSIAAGIGLDLARHNGEA